MATTDVILKEKIVNLGVEADVVTVKSGYARNFLIPQGKAYEGTSANRRHMQALKVARAAREAVELQEAQELATKIRKAKVNLELETGQGGKAFGSITSQDIAKALLDQAGLEIDRHSIDLEKPIKTTGSQVLEVKVHGEISAKLTVNVTAKGDDTEGAEEA
jgi:large subunit ribosomal protein L9